MYLVTDVNASIITIDPSFDGGSLSNVALDVVSSPIAQYSVQNLQEGEDAYAYDIFFTGRHLETITSNLAISICSGIAHYGGQRYGVDIRTLNYGGTDPVQIFSTTSKSIFAPTDTNGYFKLAIGGIVMPSSAHGYAWGVSAATIQSDLQTIAGLITTVTRSGYGSREENNGYTYSIASGIRNGTYSFPTISILADRGISAPVYSRSNLTEPQHAVNDLSVRGWFSGSVNTEFVVWIESVSRNASHGDKFRYLGSNYTIIAGHWYSLANNVSVRFTNARGHRVGDNWTFTGVRTQAALPAESALTISWAGAQAAQQITTAPGYLGVANSVVTAYRAPAVFTVQNQGVTVYKLITNMPQHVGHTGLMYSFTTTLFEDVSNSTQCLLWNASDFTVENAINEITAGMCGPSSNCVTVTRGVDNVNNEGGYVYSIYFTGDKFATSTNSSVFTVGTTHCDSYTPAASVLNLTKVATGSNHRLFSTSSIPLAVSTDPFTAAAYRGISLSQVPIYKVNGNYWAVTFNTNLGDLPAMVPQATKYLTGVDSLEVFDDVVEGENPTSADLSDLLTGIPYYARIQAYTRGPFHGYSDYTVGTSLTPATTTLMPDVNPDIGATIPSGAPPALTNFSAAATLDVSEQQMVILGASHLTEIQTVTTSAPGYSDAQEIVITAPEGDTVTGTFSLRFPRGAET